MLLLVFIFGLCLGSFLTVLADRLPRGESVLWGRSHCDYCKKTLRWYELIPVVSYALQGGRCRRCHKPLSAQYPVVELVTGAGTVLLFSLFAHSFVLFLAYVLIFSSFLVLCISDLKYQILPDSMLVVGTIGALIVLALSPAPTAALWSRVFPAVGSFAFLSVLWAVTRGRGMGLGDVKLAALMGLLLGYPQVIVAFYIAFLTGALVGVILMITGKKGWKSRIAFGPFLILGTLCALVWGAQILRFWYTLV